MKKYKKNIIKEKDYVNKMFNIIHIRVFSTNFFILHTVDTLSTYSPLLKVVDNCGKVW